VVTAEFGFIELPMPSPRAAASCREENPDVLSWLRARRPGLRHLMAMLTLMKGCRSPTTATCRKTRRAVRCRRHAQRLPDCTPDAARIRIVRSGWSRPPPAGHHHGPAAGDAFRRPPLRRAGRAHAIGKGRAAPTAARGPPGFQRADPADIFECLEARETINRRSGPGGTAEAAVRAAIEAAEKRLR